MCANNTTKKHCKFFTFKFKKINIYFLCFYNKHYNFQNQNAKTKHVQKIVWKTTKL